MRKTILALVSVGALALATPAVANPKHRGHHHHHHHAWVAPAAGAVTGTVVGIGLYEGWFGTSSTLTASTVGSAGAAASAGVLAGAGTAALIHSVTTPCQGFHALFGGSGCVNGQYVGHAHVR